MIPFEKALDMLRSLSQADYKSASSYISALASKRYAPDKPLSRAQILEELAISRQQEKEGRHKPAREAFDEVMAEYGLVRR